MRVAFFHHLVIAVTSCETLLFLKYNYRFWSNPMIIDVILAENDPDLDYVASRESDEEAL
jgi:hypothetical protein